MHELLARSSLTSSVQPPDLIECSSIQDRAASGKVTYVAVNVYMCCATTRQPAVVCDPQGTCLEDATGYGVKMPWLK